MFGKREERSFFRSRTFQEEISKRHKIITLGITGVSFGTGVTHTSLLLSHYLMRQGNKVAYLEWGEQESISQIRYMYEGETIEDDEPFSMQHIRYYQHMNLEKYYEVKQSGASILINDLGPYQETMLEIIMQMDLRILVGRPSEWKMHEFDKVLERMTDPIQSNLKLLLPMGSSRAKNYLHKETGLSVYSMNYHLDPFSKSKETDRCIEEILRN